MILGVPVPLILRRPWCALTDPLVGVPEIWMLELIRVLNPAECFVTSRPTQSTDVYDASQTDRQHSDY